MPTDSLTRRSFTIGERVQHIDSGWAGEVIDVRPDDTGMKGAQGPLVTVQPTHPAPPDGGNPWKPITVTADELVLVR